MKRQHYPLLDANLVYFVFAFMLITVGGLVQTWDFEYGMLITEYGLVLAPVILLGLLRKVDLKVALKLNPITPKQGLIILGIVLCGLPITMTLNLTVISILSLFDKVLTLPIPTATNIQEFGVLFFIISISAGICEETFFRGMILNAYENHHSRRTAIIVSAIFFGFFHFNVQNLFGPIFLGLLFGYLVVETNSLFAGMLGHLINNGVAVVMMAFMNLFESVGAQGTVQQQQEQMFQNPKMLFAAVGIYGLISLITGVGILALFKVLKNDIQKKNTSDTVLLETDEMDQTTSKVYKEKSPYLKAWYRQYHHLPVVGTGILYIYYLIRHMSI